jgi:mannonate dehydratase
MTNQTRRDFSKTALAAAVGATMATPVAAKMWNPEPGIKLALQVGRSQEDEDLQFAKQVGVTHVTMSTDLKGANAANYKRLREWVEGAGLKVWNIGNPSVHNMEEVTLNLPGRDQKVEEYKQFLRNLAEAGIFYTTYAHMGNGIWSSPRETARGDAPARALDLSNQPKGHWNGKVFEGPLTHGRKYSDEEIWENYTYFIKQVIPVAESLGIRIGIHPDDPPVEPLGGIPRCIFGKFDGYVKALEIADSPNIGVCLCCGCWLEGGEGMGKDVVGAIKYFAGQKKLFKVHFRNVNQPLPHFVETFPDDGYFDMYKIMKALREVDFDGVAIADHTPQMLGGRRASWAYCVGYIKALLDRVNAEAKA